MPAQASPRRVSTRPRHHATPAHVSAAMPCAASNCPGATCHTAYHDSGLSPYTSATPSAQPALKRKPARASQNTIGSDRIKMLSVTNPTSSCGCRPRIDA